MNTVYQVVALETDKVFFTTNAQQAIHWAQDARFEVTQSPNRRPIDGYDVWMLDSIADKTSLQLGLNA